MNSSGWIVVTGSVYDNSATYSVQYNNFILMYDVRFVISKHVRVMLVFC